MKRNSDNSIIPKIIVILGTVSILGIILLFMRPRPKALVKAKRPETPEKLFTQVIEAARPRILKLWEQGDRYFPKTGVKCDQEILHDNKVGRSYYQCNPHFWQCYWQGGVKATPAIELDLFGQTFQVVARPVFDPINAFSQNTRYMEAFHKSTPGEDFNYGYKIEVEVKGIAGLSQPMILMDTCRDTFLPERAYGFGKNDDGMMWDNFDRKIFIDKFYVTNRQVNEWRVLKNETAKIVSDRKLWPHPAFLTPIEQDNYCAFYGKRVLEAKLFDAASMSPADTKELIPLKIPRRDTPWQRDLSKTFLGMSRINPDYQLTPLDCQLAEVQGCHEKYFSTDSATWMGFHYSLGFFPERLVNNVEPKMNLKKSSRFYAPGAEWHQLGVLSSWNGEQTSDLPVAFRCYEEVIQ